MVDVHSGQGSQRRLHFPFPPRTAKVPARLPQVHEAGGCATGGIRLPRQIWGRQIPVSSDSQNAARAHSSGHDQGMQPRFYSLFETCLADGAGRVEALDRR